MFEASKIPSEDKTFFYTQLCLELSKLLATEDHWISKLANTSSLLHQNLESINWVGFYLVKNSELVLGPFHGKPACTKIPFGKGVCGTSIQICETVLVPNVHEFPGHIACDANSNSEIVIPILINGVRVGVLDIDSPILNRFTPEDKIGLEAVVKILEEKLSPFAGFL